MSKIFSKQLGSTLAHIQDFFDTIIKVTLKSPNKKSRNTLVSSIRNAGNSTTIPMKT
tara:strand:- start:121 stop:291 length:171 start_codon:yes stop_codon:yes gene_type:complete